MLPDLSRNVSQQTSIRMSPSVPGTVLYTGKKPSEFLTYQLYQQPEAFILSLAQKQQGKGKKDAWEGSSEELTFKVRQKVSVRRRCQRATHQRS